MTSLTDSATEVSEIAAVPGVAIPEPSDLYQFPRCWPFWLQEVTASHFRRGLEQGLLASFDTAVRDATLVLEQRLRELSDVPSELTGVKLVAALFNPNSGQLIDRRWPEAERQGTDALFRGAMQSIRNPVDHRRTNLLPNEAFAAIGVVAYLIERANSLALQKYVYPFLPRGDRARNIILTKRFDVDGDGEEETLVAVAEGGEAGSEVWSRLLVVRAGGTEIIRGETRALSGAGGAQLHCDYDLDGDGRKDILFSAGSSQSDGSVQFQAYGVSYHDDGQIYPILDERGHPLNSHSLGFEVIQPPDLLYPAVAVGYRDDRTPIYWAVEDGRFVEVQRP